MNEVKIELYLNNSWVEQEAIVQDMEIYEIMHKKLKNADNNAKVTFAPNENLYNQLRVLCNERENIKARIKRNGTVVFTGYIRKTLAIEKRLQLEPLKIELISPSYLLKRKVNQTLIYNQKTVSYIAYDLLSKAGVTDIESFSISATIPVLKVLEDKETYFSVLEDLLFEYGYVFDFNADGKFVVRNLTPTIPENPYEFNSGNLRDKVEQKKNEEEFEKVIVQWKDIITLQNAIMFSDTTGAKDGYKCYIELDPGKYLGEKDDGTGKEWYPDLVHEKGKVVYFSNPSLDIVKDAGISVEKFQVENDKILLSIKNTNIYYKQVIKKLDIFAQSVLVEANGDNKTVIINVTGTEKIFEYKAKYIHSKTYADNLASLLVNYYKYSDFTYNFTTQVETHVGDIVIVTEHGIGTNTVRITARKYNPLIEHYRYEAEAIDEYVPAEATTSSTQAGSSSSDYINSIGTIIAQNNVNIIDIKLYQEKTTQPEVPSGDVTYTISTGQISGVDNGWQVSPPNSTRKPIWMINYTTAVPLVQDEVVIPSNAWSAPVKIYMGTPLYLGTTSTEPNQSTFANTRIEGDWCLCTADAAFYKWDGTNWVTSGITTDNKMAALQDLLAIANASDATAFCQTLVAQDAFIQNLMAKNLQLQTGGAIYSGGYDNIGNNISGSAGVYINADGIGKFEQIEICNSGIENSKININFKGIWNMGTWGSPQAVISNANSVAYFKTAALSSNKIILIYMLYENSQYNLYEVVKKNNVWGSPVKIIDNVYLGDIAICALENDKLLLVYDVMEGNYKKIYEKVRERDGKYGQAKLIETSDSGAIFGEKYLLRNGNTVKLLYYYWEPDTLTNCFREKDRSASGQWGTTNKIAEITNPAAPFEFLHDGTLLCVYQKASSPYNLVERVRGTSGVWGAETNINSANSDCPRLKKMPDSTVVCVYRDRSLGTEKGRMIERSTVNGTWTTYQEIITESIFQNDIYIDNLFGVLGVIYKYNGSQDIIKEIVNSSYYLFNIPIGKYPVDLGAGIVEEGTNLNGSYIKFSSGIMICFGTLTVNSISYTTVNNNISTYGWSHYMVSYATGLSIQLPASYINVNSYSTVITENGGRTALPYAMNSTSSNVLVGYIINNNTIFPVKLNWITIGRWK